MTQISHDNPFATRSPKQPNMKTSLSIPAKKITIRDMIHKARGMGLGEFCRAYPSPTLIVLSQVDHNQRDHMFTTGQYSASAFRKGSGDFLDRFIYPILKKPHSAFPNMITIGRARNNDIAINCPNLSKFHAYFTQNDASWFLTDARSTNGTFIDHHRIPAKTPLEVKANSELSFSPELVTRLVSPPSLFFYLEQASRASA